MKTAILFLITFISAASFAAQSTIYCESEGHIYNAFSEEGHYKCADDLFGGSACFTGDAAKVAAKISDISWDEEWLEGGYVIDNDEVGYLYKDGPNELQEEVSMIRCDDDFFRK